MGQPPALSPRVNISENALRRHFKKHIAELGGDFERLGLERLEKLLKGHDPRRLPRLSRPN
jgi:hypothetical protein